MITLYKKHATSIGIWTIESEGNILRIEHATALDGAKVCHTEKVEVNQSGRSLEEQIELRIKSRVNRMKDRGYKTSIEAAKRSSNTNQLGLVRPMLAKSIDKVKIKSTENAVLQLKLDGHRCMITKLGGSVTAYSRQGKVIDSIDRILKIMDLHLPEGCTVDGELYIHGLPLQTIGSYIKRKQSGTDKLVFMMYDIVSDQSYTDRHAELMSIFGGHQYDNIGVLGYTPYRDEAHMMERLSHVISKGYEGLMLKLDNAPYKEGARSSHLLKVKKFMDQEFTVKSIATSPDGWGICTCDVSDEGLQFDVLAPGTHNEKRVVADNPDKYIGKKLTVQFANFTLDGKPFQPVALRWREDV